jgi:hypothetical protein
VNTVPAGTLRERRLRALGLPRLRLRRARGVAVTPADEVGDAVPPVDPSTVTG